MGLFVSGGYFVIVLWRCVALCLCHSIIVRGWWYIIIVISEIGDRGVIIHGWWFITTIMR